jgi:5-methylcytosine-specific restriction enzyme subunit McrC
MERKIPIYNIYHMLCYAWNVLDEKEVVKVDIPDNYSMIDLFAKVLNAGTDYLIKRGLDRGYIEANEELSSIKGKIDFPNSLNKLSFQNAKAYCIYDNFTYDVIHNRVLKSTFTKLLKLKEIKSDIRKDIAETLRYFSDVEYTDVNRKIVKSIKLNRNNHYYKLLLEICLLIEENLAIDENAGESIFKDFDEDPRKMNKLYEKFIFNYYKKKLKLRLPDKKVDVKTDTLKWLLDEESSDEDMKYLPTMKTDVSISIDDRKIILDAKYYENSVSENQFTQERIHSPNLYQLFAYIQNSENRDNLEGILLYPTVDRELDLEYKIKGNRFRIHTLNLGLENWREIEERLDEVALF